MNNDNVRIGRGLGDTGAYHRALEVARQLEAAGLWDGQPVLAPWPGGQDGPPRGPGSLIVIHDAYDTHRQVQSTPVEKRVGTVNARAGIKDLVEGQDYELAARPA